MIAVNQRSNPESAIPTMDYGKAVRISRRFEKAEASLLLVAASGIGVPCGTHIEAISAAGYDAALIGEALVTADDPAAQVRSMLAAVL